MAACVPQAARRPPPLVRRRPPLSLHRAASSQLAERHSRGAQLADCAAAGRRTQLAVAPPPSSRANKLSGRRAGALHLPLSARRPAAGHWQRAPQRQKQAVASRTQRNTTQHTLLELLQCAGASRLGRGQCARTRNARRRVPLASHWRLRHSFRDRDRERRTHAQTDTRTPRSSTSPLTGRRASVWRRWPPGRAGQPLARHHDGHLSCLVSWRFSFGLGVLAGVLALVCRPKSRRMGTKSAERVK